MKDPVAETLKCDVSDSNWYIEVPDIKHNEQLNAIVRIDPSSKNKFNRFFAMTNDRKKIVIAPSARKPWIDGSICPNNGEIPIKLLLESVSAGDSEVITKVRVDSNIESQFRIEVKILVTESDDGEQWIPPGIERPKLTAE